MRRPHGVTRRSILTASVASLGVLAGCSSLDGVLGFSMPEGDPSDEQEQLVRTFVKHVHDEEYEAATASFTDTMTEELPPERIERVWNEQVGDLGAFEGIEKWGLATENGTDQVFARVGCAKGHYALQVTVTDGQIDGVFICTVVND